MGSSKDKKRILLIDDDTSLLVTLRDFLTYEGYDVQTADSGEQGLKKLPSAQPNLIILDMSMPGMGGIGFLREICSADGKPRYPVLVLTARANMADFFSNIDVDGFVAKPCDPNDLLMEVSRIIFLRSGSEPAGESDRVAGAARVLVGEDDAGVRQLLVDRLGQAGFLVESVTRGPEVLEQAIVQRPNVIVMKLVLAGMNGDAVARMLKEMPNTREIPVILYDDSQTNVPTARYTEGGAGVRQFVRSHKPEELVAAVQAALRA
jgi:CheY-like chemotaxis protein